MTEVDEEFKTILYQDVFGSIVNLIPEEWLEWEDSDETPEALREVYLQFLLTRLNHSEIFINEAQNARKTLI